MFKTSNLRYVSMKSITLNNILVKTVLFLVVLMTLLDLIFPAKRDISRTLPIINQFFLLISLVCYFLINIKRWWFDISLSKVLVWFWLIQLIYLLLTSSNYQADFIKIARTSIWIFGYFFFLDSSFYQRFKAKHLLYIFDLMIFIIFLQVLENSLNTSFYRANRDYGISNQGYFLLFAMPVLFLYRKVPYRNLLLILIMVGALISMKRGAIILLAIQIFYLSFFAQIRQFGGKRFALTFKVLLIISVFALFQFIILERSDIYTNRFENLYNEDFNEIGSGRGALYTLALEHWYTADLKNVIFGFGYNSTPEFYKTTFLNQGFYAHSDFVMLIHDYGLIGVTILFFIFYGLLKQIKNCSKLNLGIPLVLITIAIFIKSLYSGFIIYSYSIIAFALTGWIFGEYLLDKYETLVDEE